MIERQERKFELENYRQRSILKKFNFGIHHPRRVINSLYFDDKYFGIYHSSIEGLTPRNKFRLRWYGQENISSLKDICRVTNLNFEQKVTDKYGRRKYVKPINQSQLNDFIRKLYTDFNLTPTVLVKYERRYFIDQTGCRATMDRNIKFSKVKEKNIFPSRNILREVLELKFTSDNYPEKLISTLSTNESRFSKYCLGVETLNLV
tara:strand:- start:14541 stop:15155 length:615 start_codon:yes stop_codon:yes gene_type:complete